MRETDSEQTVVPPRSNSNPTSSETLTPGQSLITGESLPTSIGVYRIEKLLGEGGMGAVYLAEDASLDRKVALKVMKPSVAANPIARERFLREARSAAKVESDHIIRIYQVGEDRGTPFIAMEYLKGKPMDDWMKSAKPTVKQILRIGFEAATGLHAAHKAGLIHRDIKPANLWLEAPTGRIKVLDFGLARPIQEDTQLTQSGVVVGTPAYMSPEQGRGKDLDHRTDIFSLGCVLYHLATGKRPFTGTNTYEIIASLIADTPPPPHEVSSNVPVELSQAIMQMIEKDASKRPATGRQVAEEMAKILKALNQPSTLKEFVPLPVAAPMPTTATGATTAWENIDESGSEAAAMNTTDAVKLPKIVKLKEEKKSKLMWVIGSTIAALFVLIAGGAFAYQYLNKPKEVVEAPPQPPTKATRPAAVPPSTKLATVPPTAVAPSNPPLDPSWLKRVEKLPDAEKFEEVKKEIIRRNPGFEEDGVFEVDPGGAGLRCHSCNLKDITPIGILKWLRKLRFSKQEQNGAVNRNFHTILADLSPIEGLELTELVIGGSSVSDIGVLKPMPLRHLNLDRTQVSDLSPLAGKLFDLLVLSETRIKSVAPLSKTKFKMLFLYDVSISDLHQLDLSNLRMFDSRGVTDLTFLREARNLEEVRGVNRLMHRHAAMFRSMDSLKRIDYKSTHEFWEAWEAKHAFPPLPAGWVDRVRKLPEAEQLAEIKAALIERNPGFEDGGVFKGDVDVLTVCHPKLRDVAPLAGLTCRKGIAFSETGAVGAQSPLLEDISPLAGLPLDSLRLRGTAVIDLTPVMNAPLQTLTPSDDFRDIPALVDMPLKRLYLGTTKVDDLALVAKLPLVEIEAPTMLLVKARPALEKHARLKTINGKPVEQFWKGAVK
jgi:serine/threonine protein kinase